MTIQHQPTTGVIVKWVYTADGVSLKIHATDDFGRVQAVVQQQIPARDLAAWMKMVDRAIDIRDQPELPFD